MAAVEGMPALERRDESEEKKERCKFQMSMKLENTDVSAERFNNGVGVSSEAMMGVRKCFKSV